MESIPAPQLAALVPANAHPAREAAGADVQDGGAFEQALEKEIQLMKEQPATASALDVAASGPAAAPVETMAAPDGAGILEAILDSGTMLAASSAAGVVAAADVVRTPNDAATGLRPTALTDAPRLPGGAEHRLPATRHAAAASPAGASTPQMGSAARTSTEAAGANATAQTSTGAVTASSDALEASTIHTPADLQQRLAMAQSAAVSATPASQPLQRHAAPAANVAAPAPHRLEAAASSDKPPVAASRSQSPATPAVEPVATRRESVDAPAPGERGALAPSSAILDRAQPEPLVASTPGERPAAAEPSVQPREMPAAVDALSSAAVMPKWAQAPHASAEAKPAVRIETPLGTPGWGDALRQQVVWLVDRQQQTAELHVNPPHLGPVEVTLTLAEDGARITFVSPHAPVREAIEASLGDLRSALAERGLSLGQTLVSADPGSAREQMREENVRSTLRVPELGAAAPERDGHPGPAIRRGLVDIFA